MFHGKVGKAGHVPRPNHETNQHLPVVKAFRCVLHDIVVIGGSEGCKSYTTLDCTFHTTSNYADSVVKMVDRFVGTGVAWREYLSRGTFASGGTVKHQ